MLKWILIVGLALVAILSFVFLQGSLPMGPSSDPAESGQSEQQAEQSNESSPSDSSDQSAAQPAEPSQQARDIMRQARQAQGGLDALQNLSGYHVQASSMAQQRGQTFSLETETWIEMPNRFRQNTTVDIQGQTINSLTVWDGQQGWVRQQGQVQQLQGNQVGSIRQSLYLDPLHVLLYTTQEGFTYAYQGTETVDGTEAHAMQVQTPQGQSVTFHFDTENFLPIQRTRSAQGSTVRTVFRDYQRVDGYAFAFTQRTFLNDSLAQEQNVEDIVINPSFDPQLFQEPQTDSQQSNQ